MVDLEKIEKQSALKLVIKALRNYIIDNNLQSGDRLPSELELCERLGASRNIIREGMRYYRTLGIIESRPKIGAVIARLQPDDPFGCYLPFLEQDPRGISEAAEMRMVLECGSAPLMISGITEDELRELERLLDELNGKDVLAAEIRFHSIMLQSTRNRLIESMIPLTVEFFSRHVGVPGHRDRREIVAEHKDIINALRKRDVQQLSVALRKHYISYFK
ncbi:MAG: FadR family transcriptional regulator [Victivallales bacterium]|nr:FadR family transcriptional regulator [Victivallales bacterium]